MIAIVILAGLFFGIIFAQIPIAIFVRIYNCNYVSVTRVGNTVTQQFSSESDKSKFLLIRWLSIAGSVIIWITVMALLLPWLYDKVK